MNVPVIVCTVLNFGILLFILNKFLKPKAAEMLSNKQTRIAQSLDETEKRLAEVTARLEEQRRKLQEVEIEIQQVRAFSETTATNSAKKIQEETEREVVQWRQRVDRQIDQELASLKNDLKSEFVEKVFAKATQMAVSDLDNKAHDSLIRQFATSLKEHKS